MELRQLPAQGHPPVAQYLQHIRQRLAQPVGRFVEHHGPDLAADLRQRRAPLLLSGGQKTLEGEPPRVQPGHRQRRDGGAAAGDGLHLHAVFAAQRHQLLPRIADGRRPRVGDQGAHLAAQQPLQNGLSRRRPVVLVVAHQRLSDVKMVQQLHADPGVLRRDKIGLGQRLHRPGRQVAQVADGRGHQV